ncbi:unnamed protein product, partial [Iphiclides podalirius]
MAFTFRLVNGSIFIITPGGSRHRVVTMAELELIPDSVSPRDEPGTTSKRSAPNVAVAVGPGQASSVVSRQARGANPRTLRSAVKKQTTKQT